MKSKQIVGMAAWAALVFAGGAYGQFTPGHVFVSDSAGKSCAGAQYGWDRIYQIDPATGAVSLFAELSGAECGVISGLVFTPDGSGLRASLRIKSEIIEFDSDGNYEVVLDGTRGVDGPWGGNNLQYDSLQRLHVVNHYSRNIIRYRPDDGTGTIIADFGNGIGGGGPIAIAADGDLYYANWLTGCYVLRITPQNQVSLFEDYGNTICPVAITADGSGYVYVALLGVGVAEIYRYQAGDPGSKELLASGFPFGGGITMAMSSDHWQIYVSTIGNQLYSLDPVDGGVTLVADAIAESGAAAAGIAVVPPGPIPASSLWGSAVMAIAVLTIATLVLTQNRRSSTVSRGCGHQRHGAPRC